MYRALSLLSLWAFFLLTTAAGQGRNRMAPILAGVVVFEDGKPVLEPVQVYLTCSGSVRQRVSTQPGGQFNFQWGDSTSTITEEKETTGSPSGGRFGRFNRLGRGLDDDGAFGSGRVLLGRVNLSDCDISAALPGFVSDVIHLGIHGILDNPDVGSLMLSKLDRVSGTTVSFKSLKAPRKATKAYQKAQRELGKKKINYSKAVKELEKATKAYPGFAAAWYLLGVCRSAQGDRKSAFEEFEKAVAADPDYLVPYIAMAELRQQRGRYHEAAELSSRVLQRNPEVIRAYYVHAYANYSLGRIDIAERSVRKVQESKEAVSYPGTHYLLGLVLAAKRDYSSAASEFRRFLELNPGFEQAPELERRMLEWEAQGLIEKASSG
ncbi:MAG: tetratricopeptide repeat protein [Acidobacteriota bacterium]